VLNLDGNQNCSELPEINVPLHPNQKQRIKFRLSASTRKPSLDFLWLADSSSTFKKYLEKLSATSPSLVALVQKYSEDYQFGFVYEYYPF